MRILVNKEDHVVDIRFRGGNSIRLHPGQYVQIDLDSEVIYEAIAESGNNVVVFAKNFIMQTEKPDWNNDGF